MDPRVKPAGDHGASYVRCCQGLRLRTSHLPLQARQASPCIQDEVPSRSKLAKNSWQVSPPSSLRAEAIGVTVPRVPVWGFSQARLASLPPLVMTSVAA